MTNKRAGIKIETCPSNTLQPPPLGPLSDYYDRGFFEIKRNRWNE
jgi:hypothetical protein